MNDNTTVQMRYSDEQNMQCEDSTIDDSSIQQNLFSTSSDWNSQQSSYSSPASYSKSQGKGSKKVKSEDDDDADIDHYVQLDVQRIPVKTLRKIIPKLRIAVYCSDLMTAGKRKLKHLWDERPSEWPQNIPFKDPNNACKDAKKPGKDELGPMFNFLKEKYIQSQGSPRQTAASVSSEGDYKFSQQVMAESSTDKDAAFYSSVSSNPILPQIQYEQQSDDRSNSFMISPKPEPMPYVDISELMNQQVVALTPLANLVSVSVSKPQPVADLYSRLDKKSTEVVNLSSVENQNLVLGILRKVHQAVIRKLYDEITPSDTRVCLMFLDAGHQMEALLDVMLVLNQVDLQLLNSGCQEIIKKFDTQNVGFVLHPQVVPQLSGKDQRLQTSSTSSAIKADSCHNMLDDLLRDLDLDLLESRKGKVGDGSEYTKEFSDNVQLFKPRPGTSGCAPEDVGFGVIQTRPLPVPLHNPDDAKSPFAPFKGMVVMEKKGEAQVSQHSVLSPQQQVEEIMKQLKDGPITSPVNHFFMVDDGNTLKEFASDNLTDDLEDISEFIMREQSKEVSSVKTDSFPSFCQETGGGFSEQNSQILPSNASSTMIPSMVESADCADSDSDDSDSSCSFMDFMCDGGGNGGDRGFASGQSFRSFPGRW